MLGLAAGFAREMRLKCNMRALCIFAAFRVPSHPVGRFVLPLAGPALPALEPGAEQDAGERDDTKQRVAGEDVVSDQKAQAVLGVTGSGERLDLERAEVSSKPSSRTGAASRANAPRTGVMSAALRVTSSATRYLVSAIASTCARG